MSADVKVEEKKNAFEIVKVPTEYGFAFQDTRTEEIYDDKQLLLKIINDIQDLKKGLL